VLAFGHSGLPVLAVCVLLLLPQQKKTRDKQAQPITKVLKTMMHIQMQIPSFLEDEDGWLAGCRIRRQRFEVL